MLKIIVGFFIGWLCCHVYTYQYVSFECQKLGGFFVGGETYKCSLDDKFKND